MNNQDLGGDNIYCVIFTYNDVNHNVYVKASTRLNRNTRANFGSASKYGKQ